MSLLNTAWKRETFLEKTIWWFIAGICTAFLCVFVMLLWNNRVNNGDDLLFIERLWEQGFWGSIIEWEYNKRPVSHFFFNLTFVLTSNMEQFRWALLGQGLVFLFLFTHSFQCVIRAIFLKLDIHISTFRIWKLALLIVIGIFFFPIERSEIWFWHICFVIYLLPFLFLNYALLFLFSKGHKKWFSLVFLLLIGGTGEIIFSITGLLLLLFLKERLISITIFFLNTLALGTMSVFQLFNKGIVNRLELDQKTPIYDTNFGDVFQHLFDAKNSVFMLVLVLFSIVLRKYQPQLQQIPFRRIFSGMILLLMVLFVVTYGIAYVVFSSFGPLRMWSTLSIFLLYLFILGAVLIACRLKKPLQLAGIIVGFLCFGFILYFGIKQSNITSAYAQQYDSVLENGSNNEKYVDSGVLISTGNFNLLSDFIKKHEHER